MKRYKRKKRSKKIPYSFQIAEGGYGIANMRSYEEPVPAMKMEDLLRAYSEIMKHGYMPDTIIMHPDKYAEMLRMENEDIQKTAEEQA